MKFLNTRLFILLVLLGGMMTSCSKDSDDVGPALTGKWIIKSINYKTYVGNTLDEEETEDYSGVAYLEFKTNGTFVAKDEDGSVDEFEYTYNASAQEVRVTDDDEVTVLKIQELTSSSLIIYSEDSATSSGVTYKARVTFSCRRA
ncbi:hypothetical protein DYBT9275_04453 [Dyadobacter sp. CECT 9275]|uniref:Lipocalin-like domain-containing protein n=1 Tax=Dyadobacter helix TaxID=2822344 RepID=A0A916JFU2_9BACT|nr:lipocalin family protein [Dyadobacter sp. CECT 9275]CAG5009244.1 hypothetical protein DYBT9275_04453 [Dyadobacter sp. CECT 9275]